MTEHTFGIDLLDIDALAPNPANANEGDIGAISIAIAVDGWHGSVIAQDRDGDVPMLIAGEHRWRALHAIQEHGIDLPGVGHRSYEQLLADPALLLPPRGKVPGQVLDVTDTQAVRKMIADNRSSALSTTDDRQLAAVLEALAEQDALLGSLFDGDDLDTLLADIAADEAGKGPRATDKVPPKPDDPITKVGDLIRLGDHLLLCADSRSPHSYPLLLGDTKADMVWTDPPYGVEYEGGQNPDSNVKREKLAGDDGTRAYRESLPHIATFSADTAPLYLWFAGTRGSSSIYRAVEDAGYRIAALIVWHKLNAHYGAFMARYMPKHEPCIYGTRGAAPWYGPSNEVTVWEHDQPAVNEYHSTQKPVILATRALLNSSRAGDLILDPFAGSGTLLVACEQEGRKARCVELDPGYCDVIISRWEELTGRKADRAITGPAQ